jgi:hypothetical protein
MPYSPIYLFYPRVEKVVAMNMAKLRYVRREREGFNGHVGCGGAHFSSEASNGSKAPGLDVTIATHWNLSTHLRVCKKTNRT